MPKVVGVRFGQATKIYYFDPTAFEDLAAGDYVIVDTARGRELGKITSSPHQVPEDEIVGRLKSVLRRAAPWDLVQAESLRSRETEALETCRQKVSEQRLSMKLVRAEYSYDGSRLTFFFTADKRVDFRALVRELAKTFKTRIELRQIGVRDEAKLMGGVGHCGRPLCCNSWLTEFSPVSIKMAKQQNLPLNPMEISGICGRLLCCLSYENEYYAEAKRRLPRVGQSVTTPQGKGQIVGLNIFTEKMRVELENQMLIDIGVDEIGEKPSDSTREQKSPSARSSDHPESESAASRPHTEESERPAAQHSRIEASKSRRSRRRGKKARRNSPKT